MSVSISLSASNAVPSPSEPFWIVKLNNHSHYHHVRLKRVFAADGARHRVVLVDARRLITCADRDNTDYVLRPVNEWHSGKVRGIREFLDPSNARVPEMPYVTVSARRTRGLAGLLGLEKEGVVAFRNGQHRARYLFAAGAQCFPVEVHEREAALLHQMCGASDEARAALEAATLEVATAAAAVAAAAQTRS
ncbi:plasmid fertility inhibition factor family protein [Paraburkholderia sp. GAS42]|uniref:plasmid fertility inhibition factor family protein n=1 Tax=Paraburkholderia sp. GAS42 TaxID=3035135 RepID=UPI003D204261